MRLRGLLQLFYRQHDVEPVGHAVVIASLLHRDHFAGGNFSSLLAIAFDELAGGAQNVGFFHGVGIARGGTAVGIEFSWLRIFRFFLSNG